MTYQDAADQLNRAAQAIHATVSRLLRDDDLHPQLIVMATARVTGELVAGAALAGGEDVGMVADELADVVREVARDHGATLRLAVGKVAGSS